MAESRTYDLTGFDSVNISTGVRAIITTGGAHAVRVEARDQITLDRLDVSVVGGRLHIGFARNFLDFVLSGAIIDFIRFGADFNITAYITVPTLNGAEASSGGRIEASNIKSDRFRADASSTCRAAAPCAPIASPPIAAASKPAPAESSKQRSPTGCAPTRRAAGSSRSLATPWSATSTRRAAATSRCVRSCNFVLVIQRVAGCGSLSPYP